MRRLFRNHFLKSLTTVTVNRFLNIMYFKSSNVSLILLRKNRNCLDGVEYQVVPSFFSLERLRFTFTPNDKRLIQVENFSE